MKLMADVDRSFFDPVALPLMEFLNEGFFKVSFG